MYVSRLEFTSFDVHSGLRSVHWELHDMADPAVIHGHGNIPVVSPSVGSLTTKYQTHIYLHLHVVIHNPMP